MSADEKIGVGTHEEHIGAIVSSSINANTGSKSSGSAVVAMMFLFDAIFGAGFTPLCLIQALVIYFFIPETKNRTENENKSDTALQLEELDDIFRAMNPRKASFEKKKLALDDSVNVIKVEEFI
ncbi:hypothetical protein BPOR_0273g00060 [Botrytis porri]|uniref:Major facilitator superfamily (MFS) profile domain-containing protein n=1 Tax=Botrytis porri TaxID=87229 RepID=A0A4Z1KL95_9HELO|nr:hypothetical protein BPOR_0273g00060 [Botrytis porri]